MEAKKHRSHLLKIVYPIKSDIIKDTPIKTQETLVKYKYQPLPVTEVFLKEITDKIVQALKPEKIFLFGSYAYGNPGKDSDVDLLIINPLSLSEKIF